MTLPNSREPLVIAGEAIPPNCTRELRLPVAESYVGDPVTIPVYVMNAAHEGPRVFVAAAIHGDELNGAGIIRELLYDTPPELKSGALILVPVVNIYGFTRHTRYMPDRRDLNRSFPGTRSGSMASRVAHTFFSEIVKQCDYGIDFHTAAVRRTNYPNVRAQTDDKKTRALAEAFGAELIVKSAGPTGSLRRTAVKAGVPTIILEAGEVWKIEPSVLEVGVRGVLNVLKWLDMIDGKPVTPSYQVQLRRTVWTRADTSGLLIFHAAPGDLVSKGDVLATIVSLFGKEQVSMEAPINGIVLGMSTMPAVTAGNPVYHIGVLSKRQLERVEKRVKRRSDASPYARAQEDLATNITVHDPEGESS